MRTGSTGEDDLLDSLLGAIRAEAAEPSIGWASAPTRLTGGFWAQIWRIELANAGPGLRGPLVARVMPDPVVAAQETAVQGFLANAGFPTPKVRLAAGPGLDLDQAWMLMEVASGRMLLGDLSGVGALVRLPVLARKMPDVLAKHAAALHRVDPTECPPIVSVDETIEKWRAIVADVDRTDLAAVADWLLDNRPPGGRRVICHGDLHPFNVLSGATGDTVLDWSAARLTDPAYDLAYTRLLLGNPALVVPRPLAPVLAAAGRWLASRFVRTYEQLTTEPIDDDQLRWFTSVQMLHILAEVVEDGGEVSRDEEHPFRLLAAPLSAALQDATGIRLATGAPT